MKKVQAQQETGHVNVFFSAFFNILCILLVVALSLLFLRFLFSYLYVFSYRMVAIFLIAIFLSNILRN